MLKCLVVFMTVLFSLYGISYGQTFNVSTTAQLRTAFDNANVNGEDDTIILAAGTYKTTDDGLGTFKFADTEAHNLTIKAKDDLTANDVILDGANTHQVLNLTNTKRATFTLDRVTIKNGRSDSNSNGGGVYTDNGLIITNSTISGNTASNGGGIYGSTATVSNSTISGNTASNGGGIYGSTVTVSNSTISGNTIAGSSYSSSNNGGGIYGSTVIVTNSIISGNTAPTWNSTYFPNGGGIYGSTVSVTNSRISGNTASNGGGIYGDTVTVTDSTISGNTIIAGSSNNGGGIYGSTVTVTNSTISGNTASSWNTYPSNGGGIYGPTVIVNSIISNNTASNGGGIAASGIFVNNIFDNNSSDIYFYGGSNVYNNYIDYTKLQNESNLTIIKKNNIQPSTGSLNFADSSFRLGAESVAIDKGLDPNSTTFTNLFTDTTALLTVQNALQTDKDGNTRIVGVAIDLGTYEYGSTFAVNNCAAIVSSNLVVHMPIVTYSGYNFWVDLQYNSGNGTLTFKDYGLINDLTPYSNCTVPTLTSDFNLYIPALLLGNNSYWLNLQYISSGFVITGAGSVNMQNKYVVTPSAGMGGSINPSTPQTVTQGSITTFTVTPNITGYTALVGGTCGGNLLGSTYTTSAINADCTVVANFTQSKKYKDNGNGTVTDKTSGLTWQKGENSSKFNWYQASGIYDSSNNPSSQSVCGSLSLAGGGWRLPTVTELQNLVDTNYIPTIDPIFSGTHSDGYYPFYWSSTTYADYTDFAWIVYFSSGHVSSSNKSYYSYVRCVRGGQ